MFHVQQKIDKPHVRVQQLIVLVVSRRIRTCGRFADVIRPIPPFTRLSRGRCLERLFTLKGTQGHEGPYQAFYRSYETFKEPYKAF